MLHFFSRMLFLLAAMTLSACTAYAPAKHPEPVPPPLTTHYSKQLILDNDLLEVSYYQTNSLQSEAYAIQVGDILKVSLSGRPEMTTDSAKVLPDGTISLNAVGQISAAGKSVKELSKAIAHSYTKKGILSPEVAVIPLKIDQRLSDFMSSLQNRDRGSTLARRVYEHQPLELPFIKPIKTVNREINDVRNEIRKNYASIFGKQLNVTVNIIERKRQEVYVMGEVRIPGTVSLERDDNALIAIAAAGGLASTANRDYIFVVRFLPDGSYYHWFLNHDQAFSSPEDTRLTHHLRTSDIVYVPRSAINNANEFIDQYIRKLIPLPANINFVNSIN